MNKAIQALAVVALAAIAMGSGARAQAQSQYPVIDKLAAQVIAHYENSTCQQIAAQKQQPPSGQKAMEMQRAVQYLHQNPQAAQYFINKVASPIANKMFSCGMIP